MDVICAYGNERGVLSTPARARAETSREAGPLLHAHSRNMHRPNSKRPQMSPRMRFGTNRRKRFRAFGRYLKMRKHSHGAGCRSIPTISRPGTACGTVFFFVATQKRCCDVPRPQISLEPAASSFACRMEMPARSRKTSFLLRGDYHRLSSCAEFLSSRPARADLTLVSPHRLCRHLRRRVSHEGPSSLIFGVGRPAGRIHRGHVLLDVPSAGGRGAPAPPTSPRALRELPPTALRRHRPRA